MNRKKHIEKFAKLSEYILGHRPDEFGLVPDENGYIKIKEFLQVLSETEGWRHIRKSYINEMLLVLGNPPIEVEETKIRAKNYISLSDYKICEDLPKLLYTGIKQKSYPSVLEHGVCPTFFSKVICCATPDMAERIGKRRSPHPVILTVHTAKMTEQGISFSHSGNHLLYLADRIPGGCFTGPSLPKESPITKKPDKKPEPIEIYKQQSQAGSFSLSVERDEKKYKGRKKEKDMSWKNNKKRLRREKQRSWADE